MADRKTLTLRANQGQDEANYGTEKYPVNLITHTVEVPEEAAPGLLSVGGFTIDPEAVAVTPGFVRLIDMAGDGCSWGGVSYTPDAAGVVTVPVVAAADLAAHGYFSAPATVEPSAAEATTPVVTEAPDAPAADLAAQPAA